MKVAVTSLGEALESPVDQRFGRARFFILYDTESKQWSAHDNEQNLHAAQGAGIQAAQLIAGLGAELVVTGHCGPKAFTTLTAAGIEVYSGADGTVQEALAALDRGDLQAASSANVDSHSGSI